MSLRETLVGTFKPVISLCHATARTPFGWKEAAHKWFEFADRPEEIQYILGMDIGTVDEIEASNWDEHFPKFGSVEIAWNCGRRCAVDGWNATGLQARGELLITVSDDWFPCEHWDTELLNVIGDLSKEAVVDVSTGGNENLLTFSILTRAYFDRLTRDYEYNRGLFYHGDKDNPEGYIGMYADNDFDVLAKHDKVVISAKRLLFPHNHPFYQGKGPEAMDEIHKRQHRSEAWKVGERVFRRRMRDLGFTLHERPTIAVMLPGENYSATWVNCWTSLFGHLLKDFQTQPVFAYSTNVYTTRISMAENVIENIHPEPEYVLWIDDDNPVMPRQFEMLLEDLREHPEIDMVAGWCGFNHQNVNRVKDIERVCCGYVDSEMKARLMSREEFLSGPDHLKEVGYTGFPCLLMRGSCLRDVGHLGFLPLLGSSFPYGLSGEDLAFCIRAREKGKRIFVDKRVRVAHLKLTPDFMTDHQALKKEEAKQEVA
jgi:hypothetical protein